MVPHSAPRLSFTRADTRKNQKNQKIPKLSKNSKELAEIREFIWQVQKSPERVFYLHEV
jgi:hypothetical protein